MSTTSLAPQIIRHSLLARTARREVTGTAEDSIQALRPTISGVFHTTERRGLRIEERVVHGAFDTYQLVRHGAAVVVPTLPRHLHNFLTGRGAAFKPPVATAAPA